jgi:acetyl-CoA C-acetyltransferase
VYASRPPAARNAGPGTFAFAWRNVQGDVDVLPRCIVDPHAMGAVSVETYTVTFDREGAPERGILACRTPGGERTWGNVVEADALALLCAEEGIGRTGTLASDGIVALDG